MKLYIATLIKHDEYDITAKTFVGKTPQGVAVKVSDYLDNEQEVPYDFCDILTECENGNEKGEPLSIGADTDLCHEFLLTTSIQEV